MIKWVLSSLIVFLSVILFGGVDLWAQVIVIGVWILGAKVQPLRGDVFPFYIGIGILMFFVFWGAKELLPAQFFFEPYWRISLREDYDVVLGGIHHPEWMRFIKLLIAVAGVAGLVWWWRSFSDTRTLRIHLAWSGFIVAVVVAICSFGLRDEAIFKIRETVGYDRFGPFPNRNHTGAFMVLGLFLGWGCGWESFKHRLTLQWVLASAGMIVLGMGLIASNSRGAIASGLLSLLIILILICFYQRDFRFLVVGLALVLIGASFVSLSGTSFMKRVQGNLLTSNVFEGRIEIWRDAIKVIQDAPWLGHGAGMYEEVAPFYQTQGKPNHQVLHPESAYLQGVAELGLCLSIFGAGLILLMTIPAWDEMRLHHQFPLRICALGGLIAMAIHSSVDVAFFRWGNAVMTALCWVIFTSRRLPSVDESLKISRWSLLLPVLCFLGLSLIAWRTGTRWGEVETRGLSTAKLEQWVKQDPLNGRYRHERGLRSLESPEKREMAYQDFRLSHQLLPTVWTLPVEAARAVQPYSEGIALSFWGRGIERSGHRSDEILMMAVGQTKALPRASLFWRQFVELHPALIPTYLIQEKPLDPKILFEIWKESRGGLKIMELGVDERRNFYEAIIQLNEGLFWDEWIKRQGVDPGEERERWASVYHRLGEDEKAWGWMVQLWTPIALPSMKEGKEDLLKNEWIQNPQNGVNTRNWIEWLNANGRIEERDQVLMQTVAGSESALWFRQLAAQVMAEKKNYREAVELILK